MRNRQIREVAIIWSDVQTLRNTYGRISHGFVRSHDTFWLSSTPTRVNDGRHFFSGSRDGHRNGRTRLDDVVPCLGRSRILGTERKRDRVNGTRDSILHFLPRFLVELSNKNHFGFGVLQNVTSCFGSKCWVDLLLILQTKCENIDCCTEVHEQINHNTSVLNGRQKTELQIIESIESCYECQL